MPGPPRPVIGLSHAPAGRLFAVTVDEHVYFFTEAGVPDEPIGKLTAADLQPQP